MQNKLTYTIQPNESITRFLYTDIEFERINSPYQKLNPITRKEEGFADIEYPVRTNYRKNRVTNSIIPEGEFNNIYVPFENDKVDFSLFLTTPHVLKTALKTFFKFSKETKIRFQLYTAGSIQIWINDELQEVFEPFTRNYESSTMIELNFQQGINDIKVLMEDLAERDCNYVFKMVNKSNDVIDGFIPLENEADYRMKEEFLYSLYPLKDIFLEGDIVIASEQLERTDDLQLSIEINPSNTVSLEAEMQDGNITEFKMLDKNVVIKKNQNKIILDKVDLFESSGLTRIRINIELNNNKFISREMVFSVYNSAKFSKLVQQNTLEERKVSALEYFSKLDIDDINVAIANIYLDQYRKVDLFSKYRSAFALIEQKGDCSDFILAPLLATYSKYGDRFNKSFHKKFKKLVLDFRYWIDEPGNDVMWYFSENHALLFHVSQYLAGNLYKNDVFTVSGRKGIKQYEKGRERLYQWFKDFFENGFSEWNSTTYFPIDFIGFFSLYIAAPDKDIKMLAKKGLDYTFKIMAINYHGGTLASTYGRVYEHTLKAMPLGELSNIMQIVWNNGFFNNALRASTLLSMTDYSPPKEYNDFLKMKDDFTAEYVQGKNEVYIYQYKTKEYSLSSAINYKPGQHGHQQHIGNISLGDGVFLWINNPGEKAFSGVGRPSYWAGNKILPRVRQFKNTAFYEYNLAKTEEKTIHLYLPFWSLDEIILNRWIAIRRHNSYVGIYFSQGYSVYKNSAIKNRAITSTGEDHQVIVKCSSKKEAGSFEAFVNLLEQQRIEISNDKWSYTDFQYGEIVISDDVLIKGKRIEYKPTINLM